MVESVHKPVMFWKQSEDFEGSFQIRGHLANKYAQLHKYIQYGLSLNRNMNEVTVLTPYGRSSHCFMINVKIVFRPFKRKWPTV